jgi:hypothetical protein
MDWRALVKNSCASEASTFCGRRAEKAKNEQLRYSNALQANDTPTRTADAATAFEQETRDRVVS